MSIAQLVLLMSVWLGLGVGDSSPDITRVESETECQFLLSKETASESADAFCVAYDGPNPLD